MDTLKRHLLSFGQTEFNTAIITVFLSLPVLSSLLWNNHFLVFISALVLAAVFIWQRPRAGFLAALLTTIIFGEHFSLLPLKIGEDVYKIYALDFVLIITFVCWLLKQKTTDIQESKLLLIFKNKKTIWLLIFLGFIFLNLLRGFVSANDLTLALGTAKNYSYLLVYFFVVLMFNSEKQLWRLIKVFLLSGLFLLGFVIYGWLAGQGLWSEITPGVRFLSGLHAYYLTFPLIILLVCLAYQDYLFGRLKTIILFLVGLVGLVGGMFRHLWLGVASAFLAIITFLKFKEKVNLVKLGLIVVLAMFIVVLIGAWLTGLIGSEYNFLENKFFQSVTGRAGSLLTSGQLMESASGWRLATWQIALEKFLSNPLFGLGLGQKFYFEYRGFVDLIDIRNIHNDFASLLVQLGLLGWLPFIIFNGYQARDLFKFFKKEDEFLKPLALMFSGFYLVSIFGIFFAIYLMFNGTSIFYWTVMGAISVLAENMEIKK